MTRIAIWLALVATSFLALWVVSEASARAYLARCYYYVWPPHFRIENELLPDVFPDLDSKAAFTVNRDGERGSEPPSSATSLYRILVVGGSAAECYFLDQEACWTMQLQRNLETPAALSSLEVTHVHVGSVAKSGIDSARLYLILRRVLPQYRKIDAVVILVGGSDIVRWLSNAAPENPEFASPEAAEVFEEHPEAQFAWYPPNRTALTECMRRLSRWLSPMGRRRSGVGASVARLRKMRAKATIVKSEVPRHTAVLDNFARQLEMSIKRCKRAGARVLVVGQPWLDPQVLTANEKLRLWNGAEGDAHKQAISTYYSSEVMSRLFVEMNEVAARVAIENGAGMTHIQEYLQPPAACFYDDLHFTPLGAAIVADHVSSALLQHVSRSQ